MAEDTANTTDTAVLILHKETLGGVEEVDDGDAGGRGQHIGIFAVMIGLTCQGTAQVVDGALDIERGGVVDGELAISGGYKHLAVVIAEEDIVDTAVGLDGGAYRSTLDIPDLQRLTTEGSEEEIVAAENHLVSGNGGNPGALDFLTQHVEEGDLLVGRGNDEPDGHREYRQWR